MSDGILHLPSWARTSLGNPIPLYRKQHRDPTRPRILLVGGVHGDEPEGIRLAEDLLLWLQKQPSHETSWTLIPCLNVDGARLPQRMNARGVDLNRNFPSDDWSSLNERGPRYHPGSHPGSEPEVQALVELIEEEKPHLILHFHSWEPCVVYTGAPGRSAAEKIGGDTGYPVREDIGYPTPGSLGQFGWQKKKIPVICVEAQEKSSLSDLWPIWGPGLRRLLQEGP